MNDTPPQPSPTDQRFFDARPSSTPGGRWTSSLPRQTLIGFIVALLTVVAMSAVTYLVLQTRSAGVQKVMQSLEMTRSLEKAVSTLKDAETGHRGYLLLGAEPYLGP